MDYNVKPSVNNIVVKKGDTVKYSYNVTKWDETLQEYVPYIMTGMTIDIHVRRADGLLLKHWTTSGGVPTITITVDVYDVYADPFTETGMFYYDVQITAGVDILTVQEGKMIVTTEQTQ